ncbi:MAG: transglycosylase SLT domain-containing protein [Gammaproteobacteria bacterium]|nr:transglycosylase SLT domain-containing protein [Gammaproteobacteria bacterium]
MTRMICIKPKALSVIFLLVVAGCATTAPDTLKKSQTPSAATPTIAVVVTSETPSALITPSTPAESETSVDQTTASVSKKDSADIWNRLRSGFAMKALDSPQVEREIQWFVNNPEYMQRMMERARLYLYYITDEVEKRGMPMEIALLPAIESAYKPHAYSRARAVGLWQFMPATGRLYGLHANWWYDGRRDVEASTKAALDYLEKLYNDFDGDWHLALAAYNAGEGKVGRMIEYNRRKGKSTDYQYLKLKRETLNYVPKLMAMASIVADPDKYGVKLANIPNAPYFTRVETGYQVDLGVVAKLVDLPIDDLHNINPGYTRWATDPKGPHYLLVPIDKKDALVAGLSNLPENERIQWLHHSVKRGETISEISRRYGLNIEAVRTANNLRSNLLRTGQDLMIPYSARSMTPPVVHAAYREPSARIAASGEPIIHRVRNGETITSIARRYNVLVRQVLNWNLIEADDVLRLGQKLKIWVRGGPTA